MKKLYTLVFTLISVCAYAQTTYYVTTTGNDGNSGTSLAAAKATLSSAISAASTGDIILLGEGNFSGSGFQSLDVSTKCLYQYHHHRPRQRIYLYEYGTRNIVNRTHGIPQYEDRGLRYFF
jgi:hypothetical protein